jgi:serralysin
MTEKPVWDLSTITAHLNRSMGTWLPGSTVQFTFPSSVPNESVNDQRYATFEPVSAEQAQAARSLFAHVSELVNLKFAEVPYAGHTTNMISFGRHANGVSMGMSRREGTFEGKPLIVDGDVWLQPLSTLGPHFATPDALDPGGNQYWLLAHELGHVLGLSHPGDYRNSPNTYYTSAEYAQDSHQYTVMSYFWPSATGAVWGSNAATGYMVHDIATLQRMYGANMATRAGDTVYGFNSNAGGIYDFAVSPERILAIWDGGGDDTLDLSGFASPSLIDINEGGFSDVDGFRKNISIAYGVTIENAVGGAGSDQLIGNGAGNRLIGGGGDDRIDGAGGADLLFGNAGADTLSGGEGDDLLFGGRDNDRLSGGAGADFATGDLGDDVILGEAGLDILSGGDGADRLDGGADRDLLFGGFGNDTLEGGLGDDFVAGDQGDDVITNLGGVDFLMGLDGDDTLSAGADGDLLLGNQGRDLLTGGAGADTLFGGRDADTLSGGGGDDRISGDLGADVLTGGAGRDVFVFNALADSAPGAADRITDFLSGTDRLDLSAIDANSSTAADEALVLVSQFSNQAGQLVLSFDAAANATTLRLDVNGDGVSDFDLLINGQVSSTDGWAL